MRVILAAYAGADNRASSGERIVKDPISGASRRTISMPKRVMDLLRKAPRLSNHVCDNLAGQPLELFSYTLVFTCFMDAINKNAGLANRPSLLSRSVKQSSISC